MSWTLSLSCTGNRLPLAGIRAPHIPPVRALELTPARLFWAYGAQTIPVIYARLSTRRVAKLSIVGVDLSSS